MSQQTYQWIKGENCGTIESFATEVKSENDTYVIFESGRQINKVLVDEFMVKISGANAPVIQNKISKTIDNLGNTYVHNQDKRFELVGDKFIVDENADLSTPINVGKAESIPWAEPTGIVLGPPKDPMFDGIPEDTSHRLPMVNTPVFQTQPVRAYENLLKTAKKHERDFKISIKMNIPIPSFFDTLDDEYIEQNIDNIISEMVDTLDHTDIKEQIKFFIINYYNRKHAKQKTKKSIGEGAENE
jgi:hypothetical protein